MGESSVTSPRRGSRFCHGLHRHHPFLIAEQGVLHRQCRLPHWIHRGLRPVAPAVRGRMFRLGMAAAEDEAGQEPASRIESGHLGPYTDCSRPSHQKQMVIGKRIEQDAAHIFQKPRAVSENGER